MDVRSSRFEEMVARWAEYANELAVAANSSDAMGSSDVNSSRGGENISDKPNKLVPVRETANLHLI